MSDSFEVVNGPTRIRITGLGKAVRDLGRAGADTQDMKELMHGIGMIVVRLAQPAEITGKLKNTIRAGRGKTKAVVRAGGARAPYAGVNHYGDPARNIGANPFLLNALGSAGSEIFEALDEGIEDILKKNDLK